MNLLLLRHGIPVEPEDWAGSDHSRPLTDEGREQVLRVSGALKETLKSELPVSAIWSSPYTRADETARIAGEVLGLPVLSLASLASGLELIRSVPKEKGQPEGWPAQLLFVGHQPDLGLLALELSGAPLAFQGLGRAGAAWLSGTYRKGGMRLHWLRTAEAIIARTS